MPSYFVTQPNGKYALFSTVVDTFTDFDLSEAECGEWYASNRVNQRIAHQQWQRVLDDVIPHREDRPCCDEKPLRRWHDCLNTILHVHGTEKLFDVLNEMESAWRSEGTR